MKRLVVAVALTAVALPFTAEAAPRPTARDAREARAEWARGYRAAARDLPVAALLDAADAAAADSASSSYDIEFVSLLPAGDLDGDGAGDVADVRVRQTYDDDAGAATTLRVEARRGRDGRLLWTRSVGDAEQYPYVLFAPVGAAGRPGMILLTKSGEVVDEHEAEAGTATVAAYDGAGRQLWTYDSTLAYAGEASAHTGTIHDVDATGTGDLVAGRATDLLLERSTDVFARDPLGIRGVETSVLQPQVLDGATGDVRDLGDPVRISRHEPGPLVVGDVSGDRLEDVAYVDAAGPAPTLRVRRSNDGAEHSATALLPGDSHYVQRAPDVTGDRVADVLVRNYDYDKDESSVSLVDVARRRVAWTRGDAPLAFAGDVDRRPGAEVVMNTGVYVPGGEGFRLTAVDGAGKAVWTVTRTLSRTGPPDRSSLRVMPAGDVQGDGVTDFRYAIVPASGTGARREDGLVDGRTGRVRTGFPAGSVPVEATLDGRGADAFTHTVSNGVATVAAWRGDGSTRLWQTSWRGTGTPYVAFFGAPLDRDRCADLAVTTSGTSTVTYVLSGATGAPMWALTRSGDAPGIVSRPAALATRRYVRTC